MCSPPHRSFLQLTTWSFDWWDIMILILHITMTTAAHSHPHPSEISSVFFGCRCQCRPNIPVLLKQWKRNRFYITSLFFLVSHQLKASMSRKKLNQMWWRMLFPCLVTLNVFFFSICNILSEECFEVLTPCLFSNITPVALNVYPENLTNKWLQPQFPLSTVPHCKM